MHILHVTPHLPPDQAANALLPWQLGSWARESGDTVEYVANPPRAGGAASLPGAVAWVPRRSDGVLSRLPGIGPLAASLPVYRALGPAIARADVVHAHSNGLLTELAVVLGRRQQKPVVLTLYGTEIWHYKRRKIFDPFTRAYRGAREVTFYSQRLLDKARELGLGRDHLTVVYPAVSAAFTPADATTRARWRAEFGITEPLVVLNVKRLHELAGQKFLIDAFARLARTRRDVRLVICGTGPLRVELEQQARDLGVADRITFAGLVPNADVARYAAIADVFALPSLLEALPTVAVEALSAGTPVVSADHPGGVELHEIFGDDVLVVARGQVDPLAAALADSLATPARTQPDTAVRLRALFSPEAVRRQYEAVYERALKRTIS